MRSPVQIWLAAPIHPEPDAKAGGSFFPLLFCVRTKSAAIAQSVERILGKDEVASSNLASSSKTKAHPKGWAFLFWTMGRFEKFDTTVRWTVACRRLRGGNTLVAVHSRAKMQTNLASSSPAPINNLALIFQLCYDITIIRKETSHETFTLLIMRPADGFHLRLQ